MTNGRVYVKDLQEAALSVETMATPTLPQSESLSPCVKQENCDWS